MLRQRFYERLDISMDSSTIQSQEPTVAGILTKDMVKNSGYVALGCLVQTLVINHQLTREEIYTLFDKAAQEYMTTNSILLNWNLIRHMRATKQMAKTMEMMKTMGPLASSRI